MGRRARYDARARRMAARLAATSGADAAARRYNRSAGTIRRWQAEFGISARRGRSDKPEAQSGGRGGGAADSSKAERSDNDRRQAVRGRHTRTGAGGTFSYDSVAFCGPPKAVAAAADEWTKESLNELADHIDSLMVARRDPASTVSDWLAASGLSSACQREQQRILLSNPQLEGDLTDSDGKPIELYIGSSDGVEMIGSLTVSKSTTKPILDEEQCRWVAWEQHRRHLEEQGDPTYRRHGAYDEDAKTFEEALNRSWIPQVSFSWRPGALAEHGVALDEVADVTPGLWDVVMPLTDEDDNEYATHRQAAVFYVAGVAESLEAQDPQVALAAMSYLEHWANRAKRGHEENMIVDSADDYGTDPRDYRFVDGETRREVARLASGNTYRAWDHDKVLSELWDRSAERAEREGTRRTAAFEASVIECARVNYPKKVVEAYHEFLGDDDPRERDVLRKVRVAVDRREPAHA